jgi:phosphoribosylformylglycinamidine synthase
MGLLPGFDCDYTRREVALTHNDCGNFRDQWVHLAVNTESKCVFTKNMDFVDFPVRHGEGKFYAESDIIDKIEVNNQVVLRYAQKDVSPSSLKFPENPNGSLNDIAGICDSTGRIFGLMPHPEAYNHYTNHPDWTRDKELVKRGKMEPLKNRISPGIQLLKNGIDFISNS